MEKSGPAGAGAAVDDAQMEVDGSPSAPPADDSTAPGTWDWDREYDKNRW